MTEWENDSPRYTRRYRQRQDGPEFKRPTPRNPDKMANEQNYLRSLADLAENGRDWLCDPPDVIDERYNVDWHITWRKHYAASFEESTT